MILKIVIVPLYINILYIIFKYILYICIIGHVPKCTTLSRVIRESRGSENHGLDNTRGSVAFGSVAFWTRT